MLIAVDRKLFKFGNGEDLNALMRFSLGQDSLPTLLFFLAKTLSIAFTLLLDGIDRGQFVRFYHRREERVRQAAKMRLASLTLRFASAWIVRYRCALDRRLTCSMIRWSS